MHICKPCLLQNNLNRLGPGSMQRRIYHLQLLSLLFRTGILQRHHIFYISRKYLIAYHFDLALLYSLIKIHSLHIQLRNALHFLRNG